MVTSAVIITAMQEAGTPLSAITLNAVRSYFTEYFDVSNYTELTAFLDTTANSGSTPTLDIKFQLSPNKVNFLDSGDSFAQVTTTNSVTLKRLTANFGKWMRLRIDVAGTTPSYTFSLYLVGKG